MMNLLLDNSTAVKNFLFIYFGQANKIQTSQYFPGLEYQWMTLLTVIL